MPFEIDGRGVVRRDRKDVNLVTVLYSKTAQLGAHGFWIAGLSDLDAQHRTLFMRHQPLHFDVSERRRGENSSRQVKRVLQDRKSTRLNSSHSQISYAVFCLKKKKA